MIESGYLSSVGLEDSFASVETSRKFYTFCKAINRQSAQQSGFIEIQN